MARAERPLGARSGEHVVAHGGWLAIAVAGLACGRVLGWPPWAGMPHTGSVTFGRVGEVVAGSFSGWGAGFGQVTFGRVGELVAGSFSGWGAGCGMAGRGEPLGPRMRRG